VAVVSARLLDVLPIFGEPIERNFMTPESLSSRFFTLLVFLHIAVPLMLLFAMWIHIKRISRPRVNPPRMLAGLIVAALLVIALIRPAVSQGPADLSTIPAEVGLDWWFLPIYGLSEWVPGVTILGALAAFFVMVAAMPWLPPFRRPKAAAVDLAHCNGCNRCVDDCPYEAIQLVPRTDALPFPRQAAVNPDLCVSCGICMGACPSSTPFRRTEELRTGIDLPDFPLRTLREQTLKVSARLSGKARILILGCEHGAAAHRTRDAVVMPCVAMSPPSLIDYILSKGLADGVAVMGCAENACYNRLGVRWTKERFAGERDPYLRARVPRDRLTEIWASPLEVARAETELSEFAERVSQLAPAERKTVREKELADVGLAE
jgi:ferredoxin/coenzyme F420-reducing hydrogenase delta subunit